MLQSDIEMIGPQGAGLMENIVVAFGAVLTGLVVSAGKDKLASDSDTAEGEDPFNGGDK